MRHKKKVKFDNRLLAIPLVLVAVGAIFVAGMKAGKTATYMPQPTLRVMPSSTITPTPTQTPTPTPAPAAKTGTTTNTATTGCTQFKPENAPVFMRVTLVPKSGTMVGRTVVRVIPTGSCPNESAQVEHWLGDGEFSWTSPGLNPGRYRVEIANGNYSGVVAKVHDLVQGGYEYTIQTD